MVKGEEEEGEIPAPCLVCGNFFVSADLETDTAKVSHFWAVRSMKHSLSSFPDLYSSTVWACLGGGVGALKG